MSPVRLTVLLLAASFGLRTLAAAQTPPPPYDPRAAFAEADTNHDGFVDHHEFVERMTEVYYLHDADKDGHLSAGEAVGTLVVTEPLLAADGHRDGYLTVHEFLRARLQDFNAADTTKDGLLSVEEVVTVYERKP